MKAKSKRSLKGGGLKMKLSKRKEAEDRMWRSWVDIFESGKNCLELSCSSCPFGTWDGGCAYDDIQEVKRRTNGYRDLMKGKKKYEELVEW